jgi:gas vesicle protein
MFGDLIKSMASAATPPSSEIQIYNTNLESSPFIKISIPAAAVTAATLAGSLTYTATNASVSALSTATEIGINGAGFIIGKTAGAFISPVLGATIAVSSGVAATAAKDTIKSKGKLLSIATGTVAGAGAAIAVTAGSYLFDGIQSVGESIANKLHTWARSSQYTDISQQEQVIWGMQTEQTIKSPTQDIEVLDEELLSPQQNETNEFMKQVEEVAGAL